MAVKMENHRVVDVRLVVAFVEGAGSAVFVRLQIVVPTAERLLGVPLTAPQCLLQEVIVIRRQVDRKREVCQKCMGFSGLLKSGPPTSSTRFLNSLMIASFGHIGSCVTAMYCATL